MTTIKSGAKKILSAVLKEDSVEWVADKYIDIETFAGHLFNPAIWESLRRLRTFKDKHRGERCFIIGNGPSLNKMDLSPLEHEITFGLNRIYILFERIGFNTTYFVSVNKYVIRQIFADIERLPCTKFISWNARKYIRFDSDIIFLRSRGRLKFCSDISKQGICEGSTVTYVAMQLAYYMGFSDVILIGVDHNFKTKGEPHKLVVSQGEDPNHFDPNYFNKGFKWQLPDLRTSEEAYKLAKKTFENDGRRIIDATVDGKLQVFPKVNYEDIISN